MHDEKGKTPIVQKSPPTMDEEKGHALLDVVKKSAPSATAGGYPVLGEIICDDVLNSEVVISNILKAWENKSYGDVNITNIEYNKYLFKYDSAQTALRVIQDGPWTIMGHFLCLEYWEAEKTLKEIPLKDVQIWVRVHGLALAYMDPENEKLRSMEKYIGDHIGGYVGADIWKWNRRHNSKHGFIRIKARMDCYATIKTGIWINGKSKNYRVDFKYENMADICFNCGHFGHTTGSCGPKDIQHPQFGPWLRAEPIEFNYNEYRRKECIVATMLFLICAMLLLIFAILFWKLLVPADQRTYDTRGLVYG